MHDAEMKKHCRVLELDKVLLKLAGETSCEDAAEMATEILPRTDVSEVRRLLDQTGDAHMLMARYSAPSFGSIKNVKGALSRAQTGATLSIRELLDVGEVLRVLRSLKEWKSRASTQSRTSLEGFFEQITPNKYLEDKISAAIISEEEISDNASPQLADIRRKLHAATLSVRERLDKIIRSTQYQKYLQDPVVTMRSGRYVVPVKLECRGNVPGLVHDTSSSGATVFIEPVSVVEANNDIKVLESKEEAEIERILFELSVEAGNFRESICDSYDSAVMLNLIFAKARLAYNMKASQPEINDKGEIYLKNARHPLLDPKMVVPVNITLGETFDTLVITGPNTGGKTVTLKTLGLLTLMVMCGLMIPVSDNSKISVFDNVMADIGDEQSIEQSLSTFSSHMKNIIDILNCASDKTLILLDELGAGTDPIEGAALAMAILERFRVVHAKVAATTHYAELKAYALDTQGVENACCEFDVTTLRPTYRLLIGVPGRSNAFAISERLGLPHDIVERAGALISDENLRFENVVESLEKARQSAEREHEEALYMKNELAAAKADVDEHFERLSIERSKIVDEAKQDAKRITERASMQAGRLLSEMEELRKQASATTDLNELARRAKAAMKSGVDELERTADFADKKTNAGYKLPRPLKAGDTVLIVDINRQGTVLSLPDHSGHALVQAGIVKTKVPVDNLRLVEEKANFTPVPTERTVRGTVSRAERSISAELDLRGQNAEEALLELDRFIDNAVMSGITMITVIHGKGTGVLRKAVQQHLKGHKCVRSYRLGVYGEGESGVTIVELK